MKNILSFHIPIKKNLYKPYYFKNRLVKFKIMIFALKFKHLIIFLRALVAAFQDIYITQTIKKKMYVHFSFLFFLMWDVAYQDKLDQAWSI